MLIGLSLFLIPLGALLIFTSTRLKPADAWSRVHRVGGFLNGALMIVVGIVLVAVQMFG